MNTTEASPFASALGSLVESRDLTLRELGEMAGLSATALSNIRSGKHEPKFSTLLALSEALGVAFVIDRGKLSVRY